MNEVFNQDCRESFMGEFLNLLNGRLIAIKRMTCYQTFEFSNQMLRRNRNKICIETEIALHLIILRKVSWPPVPGISALLIF